MRKAFFCTILVLAVSSCIPLKIAPNIEDYRIVQGNRFKKTLPKKSVFVFEDPKDEGHFYDYINTKFALNDYRVDVDVPLQVDDQEFFFAYYEEERSTKTLNLLPILIDAALATTDTSDPMLTNEYESRKGYWYVAIEVYDKQENDLLAENSDKREPLIKYLRVLKEEYLSTHNYNEVVFKD